MTRAEILKQVKRIGVEAQGRRELVKYLEGKKISRKEAMSAFCYECQGYCKDGRVDCENVNCPMYPYMPYSKNKEQGKRPKGNTEGLKKFQGTLTERTENSLEGIKLPEKVSA